MAELISAADWGLFKEAINDASDTFNNTLVTWRRWAYGVDPFMEAETGSYSDVEIEALFSDNYFHSWPITYTTTNGELDRENTVIILNTQYLSDNGYLNSEGNFNFKADKDRFIYKGIVYKCHGWIDMAQAGEASNSQKLLFMIILKREETPTGINPLDTQS